MASALAKALAIFVGVDPVAVLREVKRLGPRVLVADKGFKVSELDWVVEAAGWKVEVREAGEPIPCLRIRGFDRFEFCGEMGDVLALALPYVMRAAAGWRPARCPKGVSEVDVEGSATVYVINGIPCAVTMASSGELLACTSRLGLRFVNVNDYARAYGRLPVSSVPTIEYGGRAAPVPAPYTVDSIVKALRRVV